MGCVVNSGAAQLTRRLHLYGRLFANWMLVECPSKLFWISIFFGTFYVMWGWCYYGWRSCDNYLFTGGLSVSQTLIYGVIFNVLLTDIY